MTHPGIAKAAVVGFPHDVKGTGIYAFVVPKDSGVRRRRRRRKRSCRARCGRR